MLFSPRWLFLYPGLILMVLGLLSMTWLLGGPRSVGGITLDVNTLAFSAGGIICGFQAVVFSLFAKVFATNAGLLPEDRITQKLIDVASLELGIIAGLVLLVVGVGMSGYAVGFWGTKSFGQLNPSVSLRIVLPAVTAAVLGLQVIFSSFFLTVLGLRVEEGS